MIKPTPNPPENDPVSPYDSDSKKLNDAAERDEFIILKIDLSPFSLTTDCLGIHQHHTRQRTGKSGRSPTLATEQITALISSVAHTGGNHGNRFPCMRSLLSGT
jgi:hypothetical protein